MDKDSFINIRSINLDTILWIVLIVLLIVIAIWNICDKSIEEGMINVQKNPDTDPNKRKWIRSNNCTTYMNSTTYDTLKENSIEECKTEQEADIIFPCGYNNINNEIRSLPHIQANGSWTKNNDGDDRKPRIVFIIDGADEITAKNFLWKNVLQHHGLDRAKILSPNTYILSAGQKPIDMARLKKEHYPGRLYILKKNIQRQTGLEITDSIEKIEKNDEGYVLAQELLQDSYLVNGHKINLRVYIVVICHKDRSDTYVYNDGFMYYTKKKFEQNDPSGDNHITTGYVDRDVYMKNPLTHLDFKRYLDLPENDRYHSTSGPRLLNQLEKNIRAQGLKVSDVIFDRILNLMRDIFISFKGMICRRVDTYSADIPIYKDYSVQVFGADVAINRDLQPQIIEINKGPDLNPKDERDSAIKKGLMNSIMGKVGLSDKYDGSDLRLVLEM